MQDQNSPDQDLSGRSVDGVTLADSIPADASSFGQRLRAARAAKGLDVETCGHALKLPARVLRQLESGEHDGIDYQVYLGGYITKYGRFLGLDDELIEAEVSRLRRKGEPVLVATGGISHSRYLLERYATAATYVLLTAVIVVPMVWLGVRGTLNRDIGHLAPLDATPVAQQELPAVSTSAASGVADAVKTPPAPATKKAEDEQPLLASMVPNINVDALKPTMPAEPAADAAQGEYSLSLTLTNPSWVEVTAADGSRLEYGLLPAGTQKTYHSDSALEIRLGNATGATVAIDGKPVSLDDYRRANVAHFRVSVQDGKAVPSGV